MRMFLGIVAILVTFGAHADTKQELILDCDRNREDPLTCTACNIYHEARSEPVAGQLAVALVTLNRSDSTLYPTNMCEVVWEKRKSKKTGKMVPMFSWTLDGKSDRVYNQKHWLAALKLADVVISAAESGKRVHDFTLGALWYHRIDIHPFWKDHYYPTVQIGLHQFYVAKEDHFLQTLNKLALPAELVEEFHAFETKKKETVDE